jgi:hypothetical protein
VEPICFGHDDWSLAWRNRSYMCFVFTVCSLKTQEAEVYPPAAPYPPHCCTRQSLRALR